MALLCLSLIAVAFVIACPMTAVMRGLGHRLGQVDRPGARKIHTAVIPATGGVAIVLGVLAPFAAGIAGAWLLADELWPSAARPHLPGLRQQTAMAAVLLGCVLVMHGMGLIDDRRALGPWSKLAVQLGAAAAIVLSFDVRLLEFLGPVGSACATILWFVAVTNAFNFLDNMDGLSSGVACICAAMFLATALISGQWFIAGLLALLIGALLGFLVFNFPPASIFMGDGGSLVVGFLLAFCSVRITYFDPAVVGEGRWWGVFTPLVILAIPLYDLTSVTMLRLWQRKSPLVGDTQHFSHRLTRKGLTRRAAVGVIWACTLAAGIGGIMLPYLNRWQALIVVVQTAAILFVLALLEKKVKATNHDG
jgi:UDP-GlcNAc:undecaprenyl-phosphate/decaprenyl-phosphate GlcNAc-1-phosphate transferase